MQINGEWHPCDDGDIRPVVWVDALAADGSWLSMPFLVDAGADRSVFSSEAFRRLGISGAAPTRELGGVGGVADCTQVTSALRFACDGGRQAKFRGDFPAFVDVDVLDISILGRDISDLFALIVDRPGNVVILVRANHNYRIEVTVVSEDSK